jgi:hypothetical protein
MCISLNLYQKRTHCDLSWLGFVTYKGWFKSFDLSQKNCFLSYYKLMKTVHHLCSVVCFYHDCFTMRLFFQHSMSPQTFVFRRFIFVLQYLARICLSKSSERKILQYLIGNCTRNGSIRDREDDNISLRSNEILSTNNLWQRV